MWRGQEEETEREKGAVQSHHDQGYCRWQKAFMGGKDSKGRVYYWVSSAGS
jgi:hypothetical protein